MRLIVTAKNGVRYRFSHNDPNVQREWRDSDGRAFWGGVPVEEECRPYFTLLHLLNDAGLIAESGELTLPAPSASQSSPPE